METRKLVKFCAWSLGFILLSTQVAYAQRVFNPLQQQTYTSPAILQELGQAKIIYLGETHDSQLDHDTQLQIIKALHQRNPRIAIAMEMFQRPVQPYLDRYIANNISESLLQRDSEFKDRWGYPWEFYAPILRFAKDNRLPLVAINATTEAVRQVSRRGLNSLWRDNQKSTALLSEINTDSPGYRQMLQEIYEQNHKGKGNSRGFERFFETQVFWDETMADAIVDFLQANPDFQVVVLVGKGHIAYGYGIPSRVARRLDNVVQRTVLLNPSEDLKSTEELPAADLFWYSY